MRRRLALLLAGMLLLPAAGMAADAAGAPAKPTQREQHARLTKEELAQMRTTRTEAKEAIRKANQEAKADLEQARASGDKAKIREARVNGKAKVTTARKDAHAKVQAKRQELQAKHQ